MFFLNIFTYFTPISTNLDLSLKHLAAAGSQLIGGRGGFFLETKESGFAWLLMHVWLEQLMDIDLGLKKKKGFKQVGTWKVTRWSDEHVGGADGSHINA